MISRTPDHEHRAGASTGAAARRTAVLAHLFHTSSLRLAGLGALVVLAVAFVAVPWALVDVTGVPDRDVVFGLWSGRLDERSVVHLGGLCFIVLWAWFSIVALSEVAVVLRWWWLCRRSGWADPERVEDLPPTGSSPADGVRRLVRIALLSGLGLGAALLALDDDAAATAEMHAAQIHHAWPTSEHVDAPRGSADPPAAEAAPDDDAGGHALRAAGFSGPRYLVSDGTMTPYSVALALGDPALRAEILSSNHGAPTPQGDVWIGGVFPAGMSIEVPSDAFLAARPRWTSHVVAEGESVFSLAVALAGDDRAHITAIVDQIVARNTGRQMPDGTVFDAGVIVQPGWVIELPAAAAPHAPDDPPTGAPDDPADDEERAADAPRGLAAALLLCAGAVGAIDARRRRMLRRLGPEDAMPPAPPVDLRHTERRLRHGAAGQATIAMVAAVLDIVVTALADDAGVPLAVVADDHLLTVVFDRPVDASPPAGFQAVAGDRWTVERDAVAHPEGGSTGCCPALVHLGTVVHTRAAPARGGALAGELFVDLEAFGLIAIDAPAEQAARLVRFVAASLVLSPLAAPVRVVMHDVDIHRGFDDRRVERCSRLDTALDRAALVLGSSPVPRGADRAARRRMRAGDGCPVGPAVVVTSGDAGVGPDAADVLDDVAAMCRGGGRGLVVVAARPLTGAALVLRSGPTVAGVPPASGQSTVWSLDGLGFAVRVPEVSDDEAAAVAELVDGRPAPRLVLPPVASPAAAHGTASSTPASVAAGGPVDDGDWVLMVRMLGPLSVVDRDGRVVAFERRRALELAAWLVEHREAATRSAARAALWEQAVSDATFANVVSDLRRSLARTVEPPAGEDWVDRTRSELLRLHPCVTSDAEFVRRRLALARRMPSVDAIAALRPALDLVTDLPFTGSQAAWPDPEGITSSLVVLATSAAAVLARHCLALGDVDGVFAATGRGLRVLPGHDELVALRMRGHAVAGDLAGVRHEWDVYERTVRTDAWGAGDLSPKLVALRGELLAC